MKRTTTRTRTMARIGCTLGGLATFSISSIATAQISATSAPAVAAPAMAAPAVAPAAVAPGVGATLGGGLTPAGTALAVPVSGPTAFGTNPAASAAGSATIQNGALTGATGTNATEIVPGATVNNTTGVFATSTPGVTISGGMITTANGATINPGTVTTANGTTIPTGALVGGNVVYWPYPIYIPTAQPGAYGGGPVAGSGAQTPSVQGAQASESQEYNEPAPEPQIDYRSIPGGRANTNLDDPAFRAAHIRRW